MNSYLVDLSRLVFPSPLIDVISFAMLLLAFRISTVKTVHQMIPLYRWQSYLLAVVTLLTAIQPNEQNQFPHIRVIFFVLIPLLFAIGIEPLLAQATVPEDITIWERMRRLVYRKIRSETRTHAIPIWMEQRASQRNDVWFLTFDLVLIVAAYLTAFSLIKTDSSQANSLAVSAALLLLGLSTMTNKDDLISQIMGLLVMEHGLFLAAVQVIAIPAVTVIFVVSLFLYTIITLTILVFLLPELHRISKSIEVDDQQQLKG